MLAIQPRDLSDRITLADMQQLLQFAKLGHVFADNSDVYVRRNRGVERVRVYVLATALHFGWVEPSDDEVDADGNQLLAITDSGLQRLAELVALMRSPEAIQRTNGHLAGILAAHTH